jgi:Sec-independent protein secretion pathway component TatC
MSPADIFDVSAQFIGAITIACAVLAVVGCVYVFFVLLANTDFSED